MRVAEIARYHGKSGRLYLSTTAAGVAVPVASLSSWELNYSTDKEETTAFGDSNKTYVQGLPDVAVSFSGYWDDSDTTVKAASLSADGAKAYLYPSTNAASKYAYGVGWVDYSISVAVDGAVTVSGEIAANGSWGNNL